MEKKTESKQAFKALSKICLNNWHYIERKVLSFSEGINFFTGHSGSGKSTVIDAFRSFCTPTRTEGDFSTRRRPMTRTGA